MGIPHKSQHIPTTLDIVTVGQGVIIGMKIIENGDISIEGHHPPN